MMINWPALMYCLLIVVSSISIIAIAVDRYSSNHIPIIHMPTFNNGINLVASYTRNGSYGNFTQYAHVSTARQFMRSNLGMNMIGNGLKGLYISYKYRGHYIPIVDLDGDTSLVRATLWAKENHVDFAVMKSSPNNYWMFMEPKTNRSQAISLSRSVPGGDEEYKRICDNLGHQILRGEIQKDGFIPDIHLESDIPILQEFMHQIHAHFSSDAMQWWHRYCNYDDTNLSDPGCGTPGKFTINDLL